MKLRLLLLCSLLIQFDLYTCLFEPISSYVAYTAGLGVVLWGYQKRCDYVECCELHEPEKFEYRLRSVLDKKLFAQPLLNQILPTAIHSHINKKKPFSPLVISLHGWTGSGKTYTSQMVAETLFPKGLKSIFVKKLTPAVMFPNANQVNNYKEKLINLLEDQLRVCEHSLIIIEEIDKLHPELIETLASYLNNFGPALNHMIFIFTSNVGSDKIVEKTFDFYTQGKPREQIDLHDFESLLKNQAYNDESTMKYSSLITSHLINHYIPFLPMERAHVEKCIRAYFIEASISGRLYDSVRDYVFKSLEWWPTDLQLYSNSGCKQVANKIDIAARVMQNRRTGL